MKVSPYITSLTPYQPGKPISETKRELALDDVYKLASNESPLGPSQSVIQAITKELSELHRYPDGACFAMRQALAKYFQIPPDWMVFGNGSDEIVDRLVQVYCEPGDSILTSQGAFVAYEISAQSSRANTIHVPLKPDYKFDLKAFVKELDNSKIKLVFLPNPNNPTGTYFTRNEFEEFMVKAAQKDILVVLDEAYVEFVRAKDYPDGREYQKRFSNVLLLRTMSKVFGLAGLRIGVLMAPPQVCDLIDRVRKPFNVNSLAQVAVIAALEDKEHLEKVKKLTWSGLDFFYTELKNLGLPFCESQGNFVFFDTLRDGSAVFQGMLKRGYILRPVKNYGFPRHLRLSVGLEAENLGVIRALKEVLSVTPQIS